LTKPIAGVWSDDTPTDVTSVGDALNVFDDLLESFTGDGQLGAFASWWGPPIEWAATGAQRGRVNGPLRVDTWPDLDRAAVRWVPTDEVGSEPGVSPPAEPLVVMESAHEQRYPQVAPSTIRCSIAGARQAVADFSQTLKKPQQLQWLALEAMFSPLRMSYMTGSRNAMVICESLEDAVNVIRRFGHDAKPGATLEVTAPDRRETYLKVMYAYQGHAMLHFTSPRGSFAARTAISPGTDHDWIVNFQELDVPPAALIPFDQTEAAVLEVFDEPSTQPSTVVWQPVSA
jgi:hypothetical protein